MRTRTNTTSRSKRGTQIALAFALAVSALALPAIAGAEPNQSPNYSSVNSITGGDLSDTSEPAGGSDYASVNSIVPPISEPSSSPTAGADYASVNAITGPPADTAAYAFGSPSGTGDGFDWASALVGAGAALAMVALGGAALLTARRRGTVAPSTS